ncbi:cystine transport system substrate-binding protein [Paraburkholderia atlantica]|uniref:Cystine transport system substrate-binding protein n=1 Tax=Paraburkholderia atlantica TaxID=2654982 RepID=A0A6I1PSB6_PARAM|nr:amino acid ABC transporter substrate-binding protein [Paraburkholderia atlantica]MBB5418279.1 cystine transport system substrate-binding protein [Paraburkholderia atlantica]MBB5425108.1 cystine transport system substrate-binding protein [Paraburkholderia atlantica]MPW04828.1 transporter substrate-binding domain-containing protein [Paraburkholderia atlantica]NUY33386.1 amino acid ABC transporter substrate-binding protein [Paraburkholderia atlantica]
MKPIRSLAMAALLQAVLAHPASADDLAQIKASGVFRIGTEGTYAPFTYHDDAGKLTGFDVELAGAIAQRLGVKPQFIEGKWDGLIAGLDVNRYDAVINEVAVTDERKLKYDYSDPYITSHAVLIVASDNTTIRSFDDLKGRKSANTLTSNVGRIAAAHGAQVIPAQGFDESIDLLVAGRVDATVNDSLSFLDYKKRVPDARIKVVAVDTSPDSSDKSAVLIRKGNPKLRLAIDDALARIRKDGTYQRISLKYFGRDVFQ